MLAETLVISFPISSMQLWKCLRRYKKIIQCYNYDFLINTHIFAMYCKNVFLQYYATTQDTKTRILS